MTTRLIAAAVALVLIAGCSGATTRSAGGGGAFLRIGASTSIDSLNPFVGETDYAYVTFGYVYPQLTQYDTGLRNTPDFAQRWETSKDGLTWTFHTRPNATWSDGSPLTAADAAWTIATTIKFQKGPTAQLAQDVAHVTSVRATDPDTLVVSYDRPVANVLSQLGQMSILPRHIWERYAAGDGVGLKTFANNAPLVAGGPFVLRKHVKNQVAIFERNPHWYGPAPHISGFGLEFFSNSDAMIQAIKDGGIDMIGEATPPTAAATLRRAGLDVTAAPSLGIKTLIINSNPQRRKNRELLDPRVRAAMAHAVDRQKIVKLAWLGYATPGDSIVAPVLKDWHDQRLHPETFDLATADALLDRAGYPKGADGIRTANGHRMSYTVLFSNEEAGPGDRTFQIIQADYRRIGIEITQRTMDLDAFTQAVQAPGGKYLDFDLAMGDWVPFVDPDFMLNVLTCDQYGGWSDTGFCDPGYDRIYRTQNTLLNRSARQAAVYQAQDLIYDRRPYIVLDYPDIIEAHTRKWTGFVMSPLVGSVTSLSKQTLLSVHRVG